MIFQIKTLFTSREFAKFVLVGGLAAMVNFSSRMLYSKYMGFSSAIIIAYITGMITAYLLAKFFVFTPGIHHTWKEIGYFILVNLAAVLQTWLVSMFLFYYFLEWLGVTVFKEEISHFTGVCVPVFSSYIGHKYLTFKELNKS